MTLVDTSIWIDGLRGGTSERKLRALLEADDVVMHPWIIAELRLGNLGPRGEILLELMGRLESLPVLKDPEVLELVRVHRLSGLGIGWVDAHLIGSARMAGAALLTFDEPMLRAAVKAGLLASRR